MSPAQKGTEAVPYSSIVGVARRRVLILARLRYSILLPIVQTARIPMTDLLRQEIATAAHTLVVKVGSTFLPASTGS